MSSKRLFIWVEGDDDERFVDRIIKNKLESRYQSISIIKYSKMKKDKIKEFFIRIIKKMKADYLFLADLDYEPCITSKKDKIINKKDYLTSDRIIVVCKEIESWYLAGINQADSKRNKIPFFDNTDNIFKDTFKEIKPKKYDSLIDFKLELLKCFKDDIAVSKNQSYKYFCSRFIQSRTT